MVAGWKREGTSGGRHSIRVSWCGHPVHGPHRHDGHTDGRPGDAEGDVERHPRLGPELGHRDRTS